MHRLLPVLLGAAILGCGYRPLRSSVAGAPHVRVDRGESIAVGDASIALDVEAAHGARGELARFGASSEAPSATSLRVVVVRVTERSEGAEAIDGHATARGVSIEVTARGDVAGEQGSWSTRDVVASETVATPADAIDWQAARTAAMRTAARRAGAAVARAVLGIP